jgi:hypothetical protein
MKRLAEQNLKRELVRSLERWDAEQAWCQHLESVGQDIVDLARDGFTDAEKKKDRVCGILERLSKANELTPCHSSEERQPVLEEID